MLSIRCCGGWLLVFTLPVFVLCSRYAVATDLSEVYQASKENDPILGAAHADYKARKQALPQARSFLLPNVVFSGQTSANRREFPVPPQLDQNPGSPTFGQLINIPGQDFNEHSWQAQLTQPLLNLELWFNYRSAKSRTVQAKWDYAASQQELIVRVAQAYLNVLRAQDLLESTQAEEAAVKRQLEQVQQRFDVGLVAITDVLDSTAVYDGAVVRRIQADGDHDIFFETLSTLSGISYESLDRLSEALPVVNPEPFDQEVWVSTALETNYTVQAARKQLKAAQQDVHARWSAHLPTVRASVTQNHFVTGGSSFLGGKTDQRTLALQLQVPIYQGGFTQSRTREARYRSDQARQLLANAELTVTRDTRNLWRSVATDVVRVEARLKAIKSAESALEATETGYEVGTRNIVDVLQAQQRLYASQFDYADSRYRYVLDLLLLKQTAGTLSEEDLSDLNLYADAKNPVVRLPSMRNYRPASSSQ